jgi:hypothetical protein
MGLGLFVLDQPQIDCDPKNSGNFSSTQRAECGRDSSRERFRGWSLVGAPSPVWS